MSQSIITNAFTAWLAERLAENKPGRPDKMVFAYIDGQDDNAEIDPDEGLPAAQNIRYVTDITQFGTLNENAFVCSVILDTTLGDWSYNWIGLLDSESDTVVMIVHTATQQKMKTRDGAQGNTLTRNLMMTFSGAAAASHITVTAETWQIDFSARLRSMDESRCIARTDYYGAAAFRDDGFLITATGGVLRAAPGLGYVAGLRVELTGATAVAAVSDTGVWVDVVWSGTVTGAWAYTFTLRTGEGLTDFTDAAGFQHYVTQIADVRNGAVTDLRQPFPLQRLERVVDELDVHTREEADNRFLHKDNNLSDIPDKAAARDNLELKAAATMDVGSTLGTVAGGDDSRITGALQKDQSLGDIPDKTAARDNLELFSFFPRQDGITHVGLGSGNKNTPYVRDRNDGEVVWLTPRGTFYAAQNGYSIDHATGEIIQWMIVARGSEWTSFSFPITFPVACLSVMTTVYKAGNTSSNSEINCTVLSFDQYGATVRMKEGEPYVFVIARGH